MTTKQNIDGALARLAEAFPQAFVLEKHQPHRPLKVGIAAPKTSKEKPVLRLPASSRQKCG